MEKFLETIVGALLSQQGAIATFELLAIFGLIYWIKTQRADIITNHKQCADERKEAWEHINEISDRHTMALQQLIVAIEALKGSLRK